MKEGSRPDLNTKPHFLLAKAQSDVGCRLDQQQLDFAFFYVKFLSIPMERIKCEQRTEKASEHLCEGDGRTAWPRGSAHKGAL